MTPTIEYIEKKFAEFNRQMFGGKLPKISVELSDAKTFLGQCVYKKRRKLFGRTELYDFRLRINTRVDLPENVMEDTIIHEMIHYYIGYNQLKDTSAHGTLFRQMMDDINRRFGRHITVSHRRTAEDNARDTAVRQHLVCRVRFRDGRSGLTVAAHTRLLPLWDALAGWSEVGEFRWYVTRDPFFNRFPRSKVVKVYRVDDAELEERLRSAVPLMREGNVVRAQGASLTVL